MALLTPLYTAPLPAGFQNGTVEIKSPGTYVDQAGRLQQPSYRFTINADATLTNLQTGGATSIVGMGVGDRLAAPLVDVIIELYVSGSAALRTTYQMSPADSGGGTLRLQQEKQTAPTIVTASVLANLLNQTALYVMGTENISIGATNLTVETFQPVAPASTAPAASVTTVNSGLASAGMLAKFQSGTAAMPVTPTAQELIDYGVIKGYRTLPNGATQPTLYNRSTNAWADNGPAAALQSGVDANRNALNDSFAGLAVRGQADGRQLADGSQWDWAASATADVANVTAAFGGGVWVRNRPVRTWDASRYAAYVAGPLGGDWAQGLTYINSLMADGDTLYMPPGVYTTTTRAIIATPITFSCSGATLDVNHAGIGLDLLPGGVHENGGARRTAGFGPQGIENTYRGVLPKIVKRFAARAFDGGMGLRVSNTYYGQIDISQGIQGFDTGMRLDSANAAADSVGFGGLTYCVFQLGRMENNINILIAFTNGANQYITQNMFIGGSLTNQTFSTTYTNSSHIYIDGGTAQGMCNNLTFIGTSMEGAQANGLAVTGMAEQVYLIKCRMEFGAGIVNAVSLAAQTASCDIEAFYLADHMANGKVNEQGKNNRLRDCGKLAGDLNYVNGLSIIGGKDANYVASRTWLPVSLDAEPVLAVSYAPGNAAVTIDLRKTRSIRINVTAAGAIGASVITFINTPGVGYRVKVTIQQFSTAATSISAAFMTPINYGPQAPPVPRASGIDNYILYADAYTAPTYIEAHTFN